MWHDHLPTHSSPTCRQHTLSYFFQFFQQTSYSPNVSKLLQHSSNQIALPSNSTAHIGYDCHFCLIGFMQFNLVIIRVCIHKTKQLMTNSRVYQLIDSRENKIILWTCLVKICKIYTNPPISIGFFFTKTTLASHYG